MRLNTDNSKRVMG